MGECLTYVYYRAALACHVQAWRRTAGPDPPQLLYFSAVNSSRWELPTG